MAWYAIVLMFEAVDVRTLSFDSENPRLPDDVLGADQATILKHLWDHDSLTELIESFRANEYFESEPLIVLPPEGGERVVVEGNRRLAALTILLQLPTAVEAEIGFDEEIDDDLLEVLSRIPAVEAESVDDVAPFLGFRHISGLKTWSPEAKARWLYRQVEDGVEEQSRQGIFYDVGRKVGSNARGVRSSYVAYAALIFARQQLGVNPYIVNFVLQERFGVWSRLLGTAHVPDYIGLGSPIEPRYEGVARQLESLDSAAVAEVLGDLTPAPGSHAAILADSRDVTNYSDVLNDSAARAAMREYGSLDLATILLRRGDLAEQVDKIGRSVEVLLSDVNKYAVDAEDVTAAERLFAASRSLRAAIQAAVDPEDA